MSIFAGGLGRVMWCDDHDDETVHHGTVVQWVVTMGEPWAILVEDGKDEFRWAPMRWLTLESVPAPTSKETL